MTNKNNNNKKNEIRTFYFKIKNRVQKNETKNVYWCVTAKMTTTTKFPKKGFVESSEI